MASCEKCWGDAYLRAMLTGRNQGECYEEILEERKNNPCNPKEKAGQFWDEGKQIDIRLLNQRSKNKTTKGVD